MNRQPLIWWTYKIWFVQIHCRSYSHLDRIQYLQVTSRLALYYLVLLWCYFGLLLLLLLLFYMSAQEGRERFELVVSASLNMILTY